MSIAITSQPASEPLTIAEVEAHLRLDSGNFEPSPGVLTCALATVPAAGNVDNGAHRYLVTFTTPTGETDAGIVSAVVTVADKAVNGQISLTGIPLGGSAVTGRKLYRTIAGGSAFLLLVTISNNTATTYTDNIADASLGVGAPTTNTTGDPLLLMLIAAARQHAENICRRSFITQSWKLVVDQFPRPAMNISSANWYGPQWGTSPGPLSVTNPDGTTGFEFYLPFPPLQTVDSVTYYDENGALQTLDPSQYLVDNISEPARLVPAPNSVWPSTQNRINAVTVNFTCGYGAAVAVPQGIKNWMLMRIGALYENREEIVVAQRVTVNELPFVDRLLDPFRAVKF